MSDCAEFVAMVETMAPLLTAEERIDALAFIGAQASRHAQAVELHRRRRAHEKQWEEEQPGELDASRRRREP